MPQYETVCVIKPDIAGTQLEKIAEKVNKVLGDQKIPEINRQDWGPRKLAYPIRKYKTGHYLCFHYEGAGNAVGELERQLNYEDGILRYLTMKIEKGARKDAHPDAYQFGKIETEGFGHPFDGPPDRGDRRDRYRGGGRRDFRDRNSFVAEPAQPAKNPEV